MRRLMVMISVLACCLGCHSQPESLDSYLGRYRMARPELHAFEVCSGFGCTLKARVALSPVQWSEVQELFTPLPITPMQERGVVARAIAHLEQVVGLLAGTQGDLAKNRRNDASGQLDCVAEAMNTSVFLMLMDGTGLLRHHMPVVPAHRGTAMFYPHNTAVMVERETGAQWAVDSWFGDNGLPPAIVPLKDWNNGWRPPADDSAKQGE